MFSRHISFRLAALLLGLLPLLAVEVTLRLAGWGKATELEDPYIGFEGRRPLFVLNRGTDRYEIPVSRQALFCAESFAEEKGPNEFRVFCLGGSTVQGRPYAIETSFTTWLELALRAAEPKRRWQVVNCGGVSYASYRLVPVLRELLKYEPDLFVIYTGHNEFLEDRTYRTVKRTPPLVASIHSELSDLRSYNVLRSFWCLASGQYGRRTRLALDADPLLDYRGGLDAYQRDDGWRDGTILHFRHSLGRMVGIAREAGVPVVLCNPVSNLKDAPPFKTQPGPGLSSEQRTLAQRRLAAASRADLDAGRRAELLEQAVAVDPRNARAHFLLGRARLELGQSQRAKAAFQAAKDEDICPLRILESMHEVLAELSAREEVPLVDIRLCFERQSPAGIPGNELLIDHVHPTISGHQLIARELLSELIRLELVQPVANWHPRRDRLYAEHQQNLQADYFSAAEVRMEGLRRWTSGRAFQAR